MVGIIEGFVMREHADDADTALVRSDEHNELYPVEGLGKATPGRTQKGENACVNRPRLGHRIDATQKLVSSNLRPRARP